MIDACPQVGMWPGVSRRVLCHTSLMDNEQRDFGRVGFSGGRFEKSGMPIAALNELRRFEVLIEEVAVALFRRDNPTRQRIESGFRRNLDLRIAEFQPGSLQAVLARPGDGTSRFDIAQEDYYERAYALVHDEILHFDKTRTFSPRFPKSAQPRLAALGRGLRSSENIGIVQSAGGSWAILNHELRNLLHEVAADLPTEDELSILGQITGLDSETHRFSLHLLTEQRTIKGQFHDTSLWTQMRDFMGYQRRAPLVALSATVRLTPTGEVDFIEDVFAVELGLPETLASQISDLAALTDGWFEGGGAKINEAVIKRVEQLANVIGTSQHPNVLIFPRPDGGAQIEWQSEEFEIDVLPDGTEIAYAFADERDDDGEHMFDSSSHSADSVISWLYEGGQWDRSPAGQR